MESNVWGGEDGGGWGGEVVRELKIKPSKEIFVLCQRCSECLVSDVGTLIAPPSTDLYKVSFSVELVFGGQEMV